MGCSIACRALSCPCLCPLSPVRCFEACLLLLARGDEVDDADDYTEAYDDVDEPPLPEEEEDEEARGMLGTPAQPEEPPGPVARDEEEDYIQPDEDE